MRTIRIGKGFALPVDLITQTLGVVATRGSGKTYLASVIAEELAEAGLPFVAFDPVGVLWGLRLSASGKGPGVPVVILGGERGDVPLEPTAGAVIAEWVAEERRACVLDMSSFRKAEQRRFVTDFAETLYRKNRQALHLLIDEADMYCPQRPMKGEERMLGAFEDLVRRGRARGIGLTLITQRPAVIHKDVLTQISTLVALRMAGPQDLKAVEAWIHHHGSAEDRNRVLRSLPSLPIGTAWFWSPGWLGRLKKVQVRKRRTWDSSSTPKVGEVRAVPKALAPVDIKALRSRIADTIERVEAEDPKVLKRRIAELQRENKRLRETQRPTISQEALSSFTGYWKQALEQLQADLRAASKRVAGEAQVAVGFITDANAVVQPMANVVRAPTRAHAVHRAPRATAATLERTSAGPSAISTSQRRILEALAQHPAGLSKIQIALITGYSHKSGGYRNNLGILRTAKRIVGTGTIQITDTGLADLGPYQPLPTGRALLEHWCTQVSKAERTILEALGSVYPRGMNKETLAAECRYSVTSGGYRNALGRLRTLALIEGYGEMKLAEKLGGAQ